MLTPHGRHLQRRPRARRFNGTVATFTDTDTGERGERLHGDDRLGRRHEPDGRHGHRRGRRVHRAGHPHLAATGHGHRHGDAVRRRARHRHRDRHQHGRCRRRSLPGQLSLDGARPKDVALAAARRWRPSPTPTPATPAATSRRRSTGATAPRRPARSAARGSFTVARRPHLCRRGQRSRSTVTITDTADNATLPRPARVDGGRGRRADAARASTFTANRARPFNGTVATFTDTDTANVAERLHGDHRLGRRHDHGRHGHPARPARSRVAARTPTPRRATTPSR